jgi:restriction system protein
MLPSPYLKSPLQTGDQMNTISFGGIELTILDLQRNKQFDCPEDCWSANDCYLKRHVPLNPTKSKFCAVITFLNVKNFSCAGWSIDAGAWELIDTDGFAYRAQAMCDNLRPSRTMEPGNWTVSPGTQVNFILVFPELEKEKGIAKLLYGKFGEMHSFEINGLNEEAVKLFESRQQALVLESTQNDLQLHQLRENMDRLDSLIYSRLNNILIPKEAQTIENNIRNECHRIEQKLRTLSKNKQDLVLRRYNEITGNYNTKLDAIREKERKSIDLNKKVASLFELNPREFEEYITELFKLLGYEKVTLTPQMNDKGIDILMEKNGKRYGVQCKRHKGIIGSPAIQSFLGAMQHAQTSHGFFVTTSTFSLEAEKMASQHPIELVDSIKLAQMIQQVLGGN